MRWLVLVAGLHGQSDIRRYFHAGWLYAARFMAGVSSTRDLQKTDLLDDLGSLGFLTSPGGCAATDFPDCCLHRPRQYFPERLVEKVGRQISW